MAIFAITKQKINRIIMDHTTSQPLANPIMTRMGMQNGEEIGRSEAKILSSLVGSVRVK